MDEKQTLRLTLDKSDIEQLERLAAEEFRAPWEQAAYLLREALAKKTRQLEKPDAR